MLASAALGSALGGMARVWVAEHGRRWFGEQFPWSTLLVNLSGALLLGLLAGYWLAAHTDLHHTAWSFLVIGVLGSYTTVSSFSLQTLALWQSGRPVAALGNALASLLGCLLLMTLGMFLGNGLTGAGS